jgi:hypothetical protein
MLVSQISAAQVRPFPEIALVATPASVRRSIDAATLLGHDIFDVETGYRSSGIGDGGSIRTCGRPVRGRTGEGTASSRILGSLQQSPGFGRQFGMKSMT